MSDAPYFCPQCQHPLEGHRDAEAIGYACWERRDGNDNEFCGCTYKHRVKREPKPVLATFYAVRHPDGKRFYRTYSKTHSAGWVATLEDGRLWTKLGTARSNITALSRANFVPDLVEFVIREVNIVDQKERVAKAKAEKDRKEAERLAEAKRCEYEDIVKQIARLQAKLPKLMAREHPSDCGCKSCVGM
jgi:hypothetical protein